VKKLFAMLMLAAAMTSPAHAGDPAKMAAIKVSTAKVKSEPVSMSGRPGGPKTQIEYRTRYLIQVESENPFHWIMFSCTAFDGSEQPVGEYRFSVNNVPARDPVYQQEEPAQWTDAVTSVKCRVIEYQISDPLKD
jgi:hypothetical protein